MEVNVSMSYLNDEKFQVLNESGNKLTIDMYEKDNKENNYLSNKDNGDEKLSSENNIKADFWLAKNSYHVDGMFKYPEEYSKKMYKFRREFHNSLMKKIGS